MSPGGGGGTTIEHTCFHPPPNMWQVQLQQEGQASLSTGSLSRKEVILWEAVNRGLSMLISEFYLDNYSCEAGSNIKQ